MNDILNKTWFLVIIAVVVVAIVIRLTRFTAEDLGGTPRRSSLERRGELSFDKDEWRKPNKSRKNSRGSSRGSKGSNRASKGSA